MQLKSLILCKYKGKELLKRPFSLLVVFLLPLMMLVMLALPVVQLLGHQSFVEKFHLSLVNHDPTMETRMIIQHFTSSDTLNEIATVEQMEEEQAFQLLKENKTAAVLVIPQGFSADLTVGKNTPVEVIGNSKRPLQSLFVKEMMTSAANQLSAAQSGVNTVYTFMRRAGVSGNELNQAFQQSILEFSLHSLGRQSVFTIHELTDMAIVAPVQFVLFSFFVICLFLWAIFVVAMVNQKNNSALSARLISLGVGPEHQRLSSFILLTVVLITYSTVLFSVLRLGNWVTFSKGFLSLSETVVLSALAVSLTVTVIHMLVQNTVSFYVVSFLFILLSSVIGGSIIPMMYLPSWMGNIQFLSINHWLMEGLFHLVQEGEASILSTAVIGVYCLIIVLLIWFWKGRGTKV